MTYLNEIFSDTVETRENIKLLECPIQQELFDGPYVIPIYLSDTGEHVASSSISLSAWESWNSTQQISVTLIGLRPVVGIIINHPLSKMVQDHINNQPISLDHVHSLNSLSPAPMFPYEGKIFLEPVILIDKDENGQIRYRESMEEDNAKKLISEKTDSNFLSYIYNTPLKEIICAFLKKFPEEKLNQYYIPPIRLFSAALDKKNIVKIDNEKYLETIAAMENKTIHAAVWNQLIHSEILKYAAGKNNIRFLQKIFQFIQQIFTTNEKRKNAWVKIITPVLNVAEHPFLKALTELDPAVLSMTSSSKVNDFFHKVQEENNIVQIVLNMSFLNQLLFISFVENSIKKDPPFGHYFKVAVDNLRRYGSNLIDEHIRNIQDLTPEECQIFSFFMINNRINLEISVAAISTAVLQIKVHFRQEAEWLKKFSAMQFDKMAVQHNDVELLDYLKINFPTHTFCFSALPQEVAQEAFVWLEEGSSLRNDYSIFEGQCLLWLTTYRKSILNNLAKNYFNSIYYQSSSQDIQCVAGFLYDLAEEETFRVNIFPPDDFVRVQPVTNNIDVSILRKIFRKTFLSQYRPDRIIHYLAKSLIEVLTQRNLQELDFRSERDKKRFFKTTQTFIEPNWINLLYDMSKIPARLKRKEDISAIIMRELAEKLFVLSARTIQNKQGGFYVIFEDYLQQSYWVDSHNQTRSLCDYLSESRIWEVITLNQFKALTQASISFLKAPEFLHYFDNGEREFAHCHISGADFSDLERDISFLVTFVNKFNKITLNSTQVLRLSQEYKKNKLEKALVIRPTKAFIEYWLSHPTLSFDKASILEPDYAINYQLNPNLFLSVYFSRAVTHALQTSDFVRLTFLLQQSQYYDKDLQQGCWNILSRQLKILNSAVENDNSFFFTQLMHLMHNVFPDRLEQERILSEMFYGSDLTKKTSQCLVNTIILNDKHNILRILMRNGLNMSHSMNEQKDSPNEHLLIYSVSKQKWLCTVVLIEEDLKPEEAIYASAVTQMLEKGSRPYYYGLAKEKCQRMALLLLSKVSEFSEASYEKIRCSALDYIDIPIIHELLKRNIDVNIAALMEKIVPEPECFAQDLNKYFSAPDFLTYFIAFPHQVNEMEKSDIRVLLQLPYKHLHGADILLKIVIEDYLNDFTLNNRKDACLRCIELLLNSHCNYWSNDESLDTKILKALGRDIIQAVSRETSELVDFSDSKKAKISAFLVIVEQEEKNKNFAYESLVAPMQTGIFGDRRSALDDNIASILFAYDTHSMELSSEGIMPLEHWTRKI